MAKITVAHSAGDETLYFLVLNASGMYWNTAGTPAFEAYTPANYADYDTPLVEDGDTEIYVGTFPATITAQWVSIVAKKQAGASPAASDDNVAVGEYYWDGSSLVSGDYVQAADVAALRANLTIPAASIAPDSDTTAITRRRGDRWEINVTDLGSLAGRSALYFTVKNDLDAEDSEALLKIEETDGLVVLDGDTPADPDYGSITVTDEADGDVTIVVEAPATAEMPVQRLHYDIQVVTDATIDQPTTVAIGRLTVTADVTRAVA